MNPILHIPDLTEEAPAPRMPVKRGPRKPYRRKKNPPKVNVTFRCDRALYEAFRANDPNWAETLRQFVRNRVNS